MMRICTRFLFVCLLATPAILPAQRANRITGKVRVVSPAWRPVFIVGSLRCDCDKRLSRKGVAAMGIYTAPHQRAYVVRGNKLDTTITLAPGSYDTVVQEWDNLQSDSQRPHTGHDPARNHNLGCSDQQQHRRC